MEKDDGGYGSPKESSALENKTLRQLNSLRSSMSFRLGEEIVNSILKPWKIIILPFNLFILLINYTQERFGYKKFNGNYSQEVKNSGRRNCIIIFPTNGVGMGHYSRMFALARSMKKVDSNLEIVFFTTNYVLHPLYAEGFTSYHLPNRNKFEKMNARTWNSQCEEIMSNIFAVHKPKMFIFDGAYPYRGMLNAIKTKPDVKRVWIRRVQKKGVDNTPIDAYNNFDSIVVPGDLIEPDMEELARWPVEEITLCPPIISTLRSELYPRGFLRDKLGIPKEAKVALVSLGAGEINDIDDLREYVTNYLTEKGIYVIVADSMLRPIQNKFNNILVRSVKEFPIMRYRNCFDFSIMAAGYNSIHEMMLLRLPSVVIPNDNTQRDDQVKRAKNATFGGRGIIIELLEKEVINLGLDRISDEKVRKKISEKLMSNQSEEGGETLAKKLLNNLN